MQIRLVDETLVATNTGDKASTATVTVSAMREEGEPMGRMAMMPVMVWSEDIVIEVPAGGTTEIDLAKRGGKKVKDVSYMTARIDDQAISSAYFAALNFIPNGSIPNNDVGVVTN